MLIYFFMLFYMQSGTLKQKTLIHVRMISIWMEFLKFFLLKENTRLDVDILTFENQCHQANNILNKNNLFLRVFELKEKLCSLIKQSLDKKKCYQRIVR